jgi:hypothetical protein
VLDGGGLLWTKEAGSLQSQIDRAEADTGALQEAAVTAGPARIREFYAWDKCATDHDRFFHWMIGEAPDYDDSF